MKNLYQKNKSEPHVSAQSGELSTIQPKLDWLFAGLCYVRINKPFIWLCVASVLPRQLLDLKETLVKPKDGCAELFFAGIISLS